MQRKRASDGASSSLLRCARRRQGELPTSDEAVVTGSHRGHRDAATHAFSLLSSAGTSCRNYYTYMVAIRKVFGSRVIVRSKQTLGELSADHALEKYKHEASKLNLTL